MGFLHHVTFIASYVIPFLYILLSDFIFIFIFLVLVLYFKLLVVMGFHYFSCSTVGFFYLIIIVMFGR